MDSFLILLVLGVLAALAVPFVLRGIGWTIAAVIERILLILEWAAKRIIAAIALTWQNFHKRRLGEPEFMNRFSKKIVYGSCVRERKNENLEFDPRLVSRVRWTCWGLYMELLGLFYHRRYYAFLLAEEERIIRAAEEKRRREEEEQRRRREEAAARRRAEQERQERQRAEEERRERERQERRRERQRQRREQAREKHVTDYQAALLLFGLNKGFTRKAFSKAYRKAMMAAHPDAGGSTAEAQAVNAARDLIRKRNGWS